MLKTNLSVFLMIICCQTAFAESHCTRGQRTKLENDIGATIVGVQQKKVPVDLLYKVIELDAEIYSGELEQLRVSTQIDVQESQLNKNIESDIACFQSYVFSHFPAARKDFNSKSALFTRADNLCFQTSNFDEGDNATRKYCASKNVIQYLEAVFK
jgi:hypothetical protein